MRSKNTLLSTTLLCTFLAACHSMDSTSLARSNSGDYGTTASASTPGSMPASSSNSPGTSSASSPSDMSSTGSDSSLNIASATVQSIETVPRSMDQGSGDMQAGTSGTAGTSGSGASNMLYRVTLRLDDGTTRSFIQNTQPSLQIGDRVSVQRGVMQRY